MQNMIINLSRTAQETIVPGWQLDPKLHTKVCTGASIVNRRVYLCKEDSSKHMDGLTRIHGWHSELIYRGVVRFLSPPLCVFCARRRNGMSACPNVRYYAWQVTASTKPLDIASANIGGRNKKSNKLQEHARKRATIGNMTSVTWRYGRTMEWIRERAGVADILVDITTIRKQSWPWWERNIVDSHLQWWGGYEELGSASYDKEGAKHQQKRNESPSLAAKFIPGKQRSIYTRPAAMKSCLHQ